jgi:hypothetical protein
MLCLSRDSVEQLTAPKMPPGPGPSNSSAATVQSLTFHFPAASVAIKDRYSARHDVQYLLSATIL